MAFASDNTQVVGAGLTGAFKYESNVTERVPLEVEAAIHNLQPNRTPFTTLTRMIANKRQVGNTLFTFQQQGEVATVTTFSATKTDSETDVTLTATNFAIAGDVILNTATREQMRVTSISPIVMVRGFNSTAAAITSGQTAVLLGTAVAEGADKGQLRVRNTANVSKYTENIDVTTGLTDIAELTTMRGISEMERLSGQAISTFNNHTELSLLYSQTGTATDPTTSTPVSTMEGLKEYALAANSTDGGGTFSYDTLIAALATASSFGPNITRTGFCGNTMLREISKLEPIRSQTRFQANNGISVNQLGFNVVRITGPGVDLELVEDKMIEDAGFTTEIVYCDLTQLSIAEFEPMHLTTKIETPGARRKEWRISHNFGLQVDVPQTCGIITNLVTADAAA